MDFDQAFQRLLGHEGGFVDRPQDPGGATCWGITERVARAAGYLGPMRELPQATAKRIARAQYWDAVQADKLPAALRFHVFDAAYNSGVGAAVRMLQRALGVRQDGQIGPMTLAAAAAADPGMLVARFSGARLQLLADLPTWPAFGKGWARRVADNLLSA